MAAQSKHGSPVALGCLTHHPLLLFDALHQLGEYYLGQGEHQRAAAYLMDALAAFERFDRDTCDNYLVRL